MRILTKFLENKFQSESSLYFILDSEAKLVDINELLDYRFTIELFKKKILVKSFTTKKIDEYYNFFEKEIRDLASNQNYLIILSIDKNCNEKIPYFDFFKTRGKYFSFDLNEFLESQLRISLKRTLMNNFNVNWFIDRAIEILAYRTEHQNGISINCLYLEKENFKDLLLFCQEFRKKNIQLNSIKKPLFIVDMTLFEFVHILTKTQEIRLEKFKDEIIEEKRLRAYIKDYIIDMYGKIPMDYGKSPRNITNQKTREKMAQNFLITFSQLNFFTDIEKTENLFDLYNTNEKDFFITLKDILLNDGNWNYYLEAIKNANNETTINSRTDYYEFITYFMFNTYHKFYLDLKKERWRKQFRYILKWMLEPRLNICRKSQNRSYRLEIIKEAPEVIKKRIYKHILVKEKQCWIKKELEVDD